MRLIFAENLRTILAALAEKTKYQIFK